MKCDLRAADLEVDRSLLSLLEFPLEASLEILRVKHEQRAMILVVFAGTNDSEIGERTAGEKAGQWSARWTVVSKVQER